ncbi:hypothetical protein [Weissella soli]|uniref:hypothetical protein n=1 Tax=Weissella soli TaxID=155866 RepID=UPI0008746DE7|nr:hypothetical protein [Weissella soli]AOT56600.1 hypothetical protein WSWS_00969 [Weissella soli]NKY83053.1 hypothetical protein [Weissella soli]GEN92596.1 hypothetical protein WSO01_02080 [Weissella soli]
MTKISKQTKLEAIPAYHAGFNSKAQVAKHYDIAQELFSMLIAAYAAHGPDVLFNLPAITWKFRIAVAASWAIRENASFTAVAAKFGYVGMAQDVKAKPPYPRHVASCDRSR